MAILEINLEKPALVEERQYPGASDSGTESSSGSGGANGKFLGVLAVLAGAAVLAWRLKSRGGSDEYETEEYEHGPEPDIGADQSGGMKGKVAGVVGLVVALAGLVAAIRKVRS